MAEEIDFENGRNSNFEWLVTLTLTFDPAIRHIVLQQSSTSTYIPTFIQIEETFCARMDVRTGGRTFFASILLGWLSEVDLKMEGIQTLKGSWPWPWLSIRPYSIPLCITYRPLPVYQISFKFKKLFVDRRTYGQTDGRTNIFPSILLGRL